MTEEAVSTPPAALVPVGEIVGTHGVGGLLRLHPYGDSAAALAANQTVYLTGHASPGIAASDGVGNAARPMRLTSARPHGRIVLVRLAGIDSIETAEPLVRSVLTVDEHDLPTPAPGEIYAYKLHGLSVSTSDGRDLGTVAETFATGANEVLVVRDGDREHLIPLVADVVQAVDVDAGRIVIDPIPGLLD